jgi:gliding motility-associated-like protein
MQNGNGLRGNPSSTQSGIIIPKPGVGKIYYIFTVDTSASGGADSGLHYYEVDMGDEQDGGLGAVTTDISNPPNLIPLCSEKIAAVGSGINDDILVVVYASEDGFQNRFNTFYTYTVSESGVNSTPVKSSFFQNIEDRRGQLKISSDGKYMVSANMQDGTYLYDFDDATGIISNERALYLSLTNFQGYGVEFSPNGQFLYISASNVANFQAPASNHRSSVYQFDLTKPTIGEINGSRVEVYSGLGYRGALQLGINGKIYRALSDNYNNGKAFLGVINNPDIKGAGSNYQHDAIPLNGRLSRQGLPPFIQSYFANISVENICLGDITQFSFDSDNAPDSYEWDFGDGSIPIPLRNTHEYLNPGTYNVKLSLDFGGVIRNFFREIEIFALPKANNFTALQCDEDGTLDNITNFNLSSFDAIITNNERNVKVSYHGNQIDADRGEERLDNRDYRNSQPLEIVYARVTNNFTGCYNTAMINLSVSSSDAEDAVLDKCDVDGVNDGFYLFKLDDADNEVLIDVPSSITDITVNYYESTADALSELNVLPNQFTNSTPKAQTIYARAESANGNCYGISEVKLIIKELPQLEDTDYIEYCRNNPLPLVIDAGGLLRLSTDYTYSWNTGETTYAITVVNSGDYTVTVKNENGCTSQRVITVVYLDPAVIDSIDIVDANGGRLGSASVVASGLGNYEFRLDPNAGFQVSPVFTDLEPGFYTVEVNETNGCGTVFQKFSIVGYPRFFTPNGDGFNDFWQLDGVNSVFEADATLFIFDRFGKLLKQLSPSSQGWDGTFNGEPLPSNDYWFKATLTDGTVFSSHFTLKR